MFSFKLIGVMSRSRTLKRGQINLGRSAETPEAELMDEETDLKNVPITSPRSPTVGVDEEEQRQRVKFVEEGFTDLRFKGEPVKIPLPTKTKSEEGRKSVQKSGRSVKSAASAAYTVEKLKTTDDSSNSFSSLASLTGGRLHRMEELRSIEQQVDPITNSRPKQRSKSKRSSKRSRKTKSRSRGRGVDQTDNSLMSNVTKRLGSLKLSRSSTRSVSGDITIVNCNSDENMVSLDFELPHEEITIPYLKKASSGHPRSKSDFQSVNHGAQPKLKRAMKDMKPKPPVPVLLVTDIGADIDDTLALFALLGAKDYLQLVAVVTSVGKGNERGRVMRGWLNMFGYTNIPILPSIDNCPALCHIPEGFPDSDVAADMCDPSETPRRILDVCRQYEKSGLVLVGIAALTPVYNALRLDTDGIMKRSLKRIYLQGNVFVDDGPGDDGKTKGEKRKSFGRRFHESPTLLRPDAQAYNFRNNIDAAVYVVDELQHFVPFTFLGKFAAYKIGITKKDFNDFSEKLNGLKLKDKNIKPNLTNMAKTQMNNFRKGNPPLFNKIYKIHEKYHTNLETTEWFDETPETGVCSHPYDPLLMMALIEPVKADRSRDQTEARSDSCLNAEQFEYKSELFEENYVFVTNKNKDPNPVSIVHTIIGNDEVEHGVKSEEKLHAALIEQIKNGIELAEKRK